MIDTTEHRLCECGCGEHVRLATHRFVNGHQRRHPASCVLAVTDSFELGWIVGIVEGEGCIGAYRNGAVNTKCPKVMVSSSDISVVQRVKVTLGCGKIYTRKDVGNGLTKKTMYEWRTTTRADAIAVSEILYPYLSARRRAQIRRAFQRSQVEMRT